MARVHHGQQGGGHLDEGQPPHEDGGQKAGEVPHHAASQGDDRGAPVGAPGQEFPGQALDHGPGLGALPGRRGQKHRGQAGRGQRVQDGGAVEAGHPAVRDHHHLGREPEGGQNASQLVAQARLDHDPVAGVPAGERQLNLAHHQPRYRDKGSQAGKPVLLKKIPRITSLRV